jgi:DNA-binding transcriptional MerR regulator
LALQDDDTKPARKEILLEAKEDLERKIAEIQESLDVINYKLDTYEQKCEPITIEIVNAWKENKKNKE